MLTEPQIKQIKKTLQRAGEATLKYYGKDNIALPDKENQTPITLADLASNEILEKELPTILDIPILSEESYEQHDTGAWREWETYWVIDPLDGTKLFQSGDGEYSILVGLMHQKQPIYGFIYCPSTRTLYHGGPGQGAWKERNDQQQAIAVAPTTTPARCLVSKAYFISYTKEFVESIPFPVEYKGVGAALKFARIAEGQADILPSMFGIWDWDVVGPAAILIGAGGEIRNVAGQPMEYGRDDLRVDRFVAYGDPQLKDRLPWSREMLQRPALKPGMS